MDTSNPASGNTTTASKRRRNRRKKNKSEISSIKNNIENTKSQQTSISDNYTANEIDPQTTMSSKENKPRDEVLAAREAKKLAKQKAKNKVENLENQSKDSQDKSNVNQLEDVTKSQSQLSVDTQKVSKDEVDRAAVLTQSIADTKDQIKLERAAKKAAKQAKKKGPHEDVSIKVDSIKVDQKTNVQSDMTVQDVVETLRDIKNVAKEVKEVTEKVHALEIEGKKDVNKAKPQESGKSKAELRAERRAKQEAQRAAKQMQSDEKIIKPKEQNEIAVKPEPDKIKKEKSVKPKVDKQKSKPQTERTFNWFGHLYKEFDKDILNKIPINSHLHPAIIKLGVQLATRVVTGSNARCIALLDALKKMVRDYSLPAKTEFGRGLEAHLATSLDFLWTMRQPSASQTNAIKFFRHHLNQLPNNVDEFDAKKTLQQEIDRYIREQIDMAGEAISITVRKKISDGDNILTYGCSSLIERILSEAHLAGVKFRVVVCGGGGSAGRSAAHMTRRLAARGLSTAYVDITALNYVMKTVSKVVVGASALLGNGAVVGAAGTAAAALAARALNLPVLVACETHKFTDEVHTDAVHYNEIGDPDELFNTNDENSPLKNWRSNPNLTPLNLTYDITPPSLITAVVTELAILPCTSAPVVLRFKLSEYGI